MQNWYLVQCHNKYLDRIVQRVSTLGVMCYYPLQLRIKPRKERRGPQKPLLPGYLFTRFDPEIIHPSKITDIPGIDFFVRTGGDGCIHADVIEALEAVRILSLDPEDDAAGCRCASLSPALLSEIRRIYAIESSLDRQVEFMRLLVFQP